MSQITENEQTGPIDQRNRKISFIEFLAIFLYFTIMVFLAGYYFIIPVASDIMKGEIIKTHTVDIKPSESILASIIISDLKKGKYIEENSKWKINYLKELALSKYNRESCMVSPFVWFGQLIADFDEDCDYFFRWWTSDPIFYNNDKLSYSYVRFEYIQTGPQWTWLFIVIILMVCLCGCTDGKKKKKSKDVVYPIYEEDSRSETLV